MEPKVELTFNPLMLVPGIQLYKHGVKNKLLRKYEIIYKYRKLSIEKRYLKTQFHPSVSFKANKIFYRYAALGGIMYI